MAKEVLRTLNGISKDKEAKVDLVKGYNLIEIAYQSPAKGDATLRLFWAAKASFRNRCHLICFCSKRRSRPNGRQYLSRRPLSIRHSRLFALSRPARQGNPGRVLMPELKAARPEPGQRRLPIANCWMARWIDNPQSLRPEALMPRVLHDDKDLQKAADLAAYLTTLKGEKDFRDPIVGDEQIKQGEKLFLQVGCIACHNLQEPKEKDSYQRLSLYFVNAKFQPKALAAFLRAPHANNPWTRMPDFKLSATEADALAAFLGQEAKGGINLLKAAKTASADRGAKLFQSAGCIQCHAIKANEKS